MAKKICHCECPKSHILNQKTNRCNKESTLKRKKNQSKAPRKTRKIK